MSDYDVNLIPVSEIYSDDEFNCRGAILPIDVHDLAQDIQNIKLQSPITLQPAADVTDSAMPPGKNYRIIAGHRRFKAWCVLQKSWEPGDPAQGKVAWDASKGNPFNSIPAMLKTGLDPIQARVINLGENLKRKDLNLLQEARAIDHLHKAGVPRDHVAEMIGKSSGWVQTRYYVLCFPEDIQQQCAAGIINQNQIKQLYSHRNDTDKLYAAVRQIKEAKAKGENAGHVGERKKQATTVKKERKKKECLQMLEFVAKTPIGYGLATRALAWAAGEIPTNELFVDIKDWCVQNGKPVPNFPEEF